ncbi:hypothetical protein, partial [Accumulibacter sp.]|uniref:hypothetical protein n=1 Tax=Accumulibacter sp. TaxID=2053492 RepID=UPI001AD38E22
MNFIVFFSADNGDRCCLATTSTAAAAATTTTAEAAATATAPTTAAAEAGADPPPGFLNRPEWHGSCRDCYPSIPYPERDSARRTRHFR